MYVYLYELFRTKFIERDYIRLLLTGASSLCDRNSIVGRTVHASLGVASLVEAYSTI